MHLFSRWCKSSLLYCLALVQGSPLWCRASLLLVQSARKEDCTTTTTSTNVARERSSNSNIAESLSWWGTNWRDWFDKRSEQKVNTIINITTTITNSVSWTRPALGWLWMTGLPQWLVWWLKVTEKIVTVKALKLTKAYVRWCEQVLSEKEQDGERPGRWWKAGLEDGEWWR